MSSSTSSSAVDVAAAESAPPLGTSMGRPRKGREENARRRVMVTHGVPFDTASVAAEEDAERRRASWWKRMLARSQMDKQIEKSS